MLRELLIILPMAHIKFILLIIVAMLTQIASAQYYGCSFDNFEIRHYACAEKGRNIIVFARRKPDDVLYKNRGGFDTVVASCESDEDSTTIILRCSDQIFGGNRKLSKKMDLDTADFCVFEECDQIPDGEDSVYVTIYHPLSGVIIYEPIKMNRTKSTKWFDGGSVYATLKKNKMKPKRVISSKCSLSCTVSNADFPCYLYVAHTNYEVSELIEISAGNNNVPRNSDDNSNQ